MSEFDVKAAPTFQQLAEFLEAAKPALLAVIPEISLSAIMKIDAARERADAIAERAQAKYKHLKGIERIQEAREALRAGLSEAAGLLLDAQAEAYMLLTGEFFLDQTLEILVRTSVDRYGGDAHRWSVGQALDIHKKEWRARWKEAKAAELLAKETEVIAEKRSRTVTANRPETQVAAVEPNAGSTTAQMERSQRRRDAVGPLRKAAGILSFAEWARRAGSNMDKNTPRDYLNGKTKTLRPETKALLANALGPNVVLPD